MRNDNIKDTVVVCGWKLHGPINEKTVNMRIYEPDDFIEFLAMIEAPNPEQIISTINTKGKDVFITGEEGWCIKLAASMGLR